MPAISLCLMGRFYANPCFLHLTGKFYIRRLVRVTTILLLYTREDYTQIVQVMMSSSSSVTANTNYNYSRGGSRNFLWEELACEIFAVTTSIKFCNMTLTSTMCLSGTLIFKLMLALHFTLSTPKWSCACMFITSHGQILSIAILLSEYNSKELYYRRQWVWI